MAKLNWRRKPLFCFGGYISNLYMDNLHLVIFLFGKLDNAYVRSMISHNIKILQPGSVEIMDLEDIEKYAKEHDIIHYFNVKNANIGIASRLTNAVRVSKVLEKENTLYLDADVCIYPQFKNDLDKYYKDDLISGWNDNWVRACSGGYLYHGIGKGEVLNRMLQIYNNTNDGIYKTDIEVFDTYFSPKTIPIDKFPILGKCNDLIVTQFNILHTFIGRIFNLQDLYKDEKHIYYIYSNETLPYVKGLVFILEDNTLSNGTLRYEMNWSFFYYVIRYIKGTETSLELLLKQLFPNIKHLGTDN